MNKAQKLYDSSGNKLSKALGKIEEERPSDTLYYFSQDIQDAVQSMNASDLKHLKKDIEKYLKSYDKEREIVNQCVALLATMVAAAEDIVKAGDGK